MKYKKSIRFKQFIDVHPEEIHTTENRVNRPVLLTLLAFIHLIISYFAINSFIKNISELKILSIENYIGQIYNLYFAVLLICSATGILMRKIWGWWFSSLLCMGYIIKSYLMILVVYSILPAGYSTGFYFHNKYSPLILWGSLVLYGFIFWYFLEEKTFGYFGIKIQSRLIMATIVIAITALFHSLGQFVFYMSKI